MHLYVAQGSTELPELAFKLLVIKYDKNSG